MVCLPSLNIGPKKDAADLDYQIPFSCITPAWHTWKKGNIYSGLISPDVSRFNSDDVPDPPEIERPPQPVSVKNGGIAAFYCYATGKSSFSSNFPTFYYFYLLIFLISTITHWKFSKLLSLTIINLPPEIISILPGNSTFSIIMIYPRYFPLTGVPQTWIT